jgi:hypothetical protein
LVFQIWTLRGTFSPSFLTFFMPDVQFLGYDHTFALVVILKQLSFKFFAPSFTMPPDSTPRRASTRLQAAGQSKVSCVDVMFCRCLTFAQPGGLMFAMLGMFDLCAT